MNVSTMITTDPRDPCGSRQAIADGLAMIDTPEAKILAMRLREEGALLAEPDADGETKSAKKARLAKLAKAKAFHQAELSKINAALRNDDDNQMMGVPDQEDAEASIDDGWGYDDEDLYTDTTVPVRFKPTSSNDSQPNLRPGKAKASTPTASEPRARFATESTFSQGEGKAVVVQAKRLAEAYGLDWSNLGDRERAFAMALRRNR